MKKKDSRKNDATVRDKDNFETYNFSQEIQKAAIATDTDVLRGEIFNTINFSNSDIGLNESEINAHAWKPYNYYLEPDIAGRTSLYHKIASQIEKLFASQDILVRFYLLRIFSVLLGTLAILLTFLIAKTIGFSSKHALIMTAIVSFQPKISMYFTNINYDALLMPAFFLFTWAGVLILKKGINWKNLLLLFVSIFVAIQTKPTGFILFVPLTGLIAHLTYEKAKNLSKKVRIIALSGSFLAVALVGFFLYTHFLASNLSFGKTLMTIGDYASRTLTFSKFVLPSETYWGNLSWTNNFLLSNTTNLIFIIEMAAFVGLGLFFFSKKSDSQRTDFLPEKKYLLFLIGMIVILQLGIRVADWSVFSRIGGAKWGLGTPGRYFLPNLASHLILVFTGLGALLSHFKKERFFNHVLLAGLLGMFAFAMYLIFDVIIYRFYL